MIQQGTERIDFPITFYNRPLISHSFPMECPCCKGTVKPVRQVIRREEIEFFLLLHGFKKPLPI